MNLLKAHYRTLLGLDESWHVTEVDLAVDQKRVTNSLEYIGSGGVCPECSCQCGLKYHAPERKWRRICKASELPSIIGETFHGTINCDRAKMYFCFEKLQRCWAHLKRDFQKLIDSDDAQSNRLGRDLMRKVIRLFHEYHRLRDGKITFAQLQEVLTPVRHQVDALLLRGYGTAVNGTCRELFSHRQHFWTFLVEPTNNGGELSVNAACATVSSGAN